MKLADGNIESQRPWKTTNQAQFPVDDRRIL